MGAMNGANDGSFFLKFLFLAIYFLDTRFDIRPVNIRLGRGSGKFQGAGILHTSLLTQILRWDIFEALSLFYVRKLCGYLFCSKKTTHI